MKWLGVSLVAISIALSGCGPSVSKETLPIEFNEPEPVPDYLLYVSLEDCDPNYDGACVPPVDYDLDCPDIEGPVYVVGTDVHGFDREGDGVGCEPYP